MRLLIRSVVVGVSCIFVCILYAAFVVNKNKPIVRHAPPFPSRVQGVPVVWVPDEQARATVRGLTKNDIEDITLYRGGSWSGLPQKLVIRDKRTISAFIRGIKSATKRSDNIYWERRANSQGLVSGGIIPCDTLVIHPTVMAAKDSDRFELTLPFTADVIEGQSYYLERGTVSPEFQDALRQAGVPLPGAVQGFEKRVYDMWLENVGS